MPSKKVYTSYDFLGNNRIKNLPNPVDSSEPATKEYVDRAIQSMVTSGSSSGLDISLLVDLPGLPRPGPLTGDTNLVIPFSKGSMELTMMATSSNLGRFIPFAVRKAIRITRVGISVSVTAAGTAAVAIYQSNPSASGFPPTNRLYLASGLDTGIPGVVSVRGLAWDLQPGIYWLAVWTSASPTLRAVPVGNLHPISTNVMSNFASVNHYTVSLTGGLPAIAPTSGYNASNSAFPVVGVLYTLL